jgi:hypothetical protein
MTRVTCVVLVFGVTLCVGCGGGTPTAPSAASSDSSATAVQTVVAQALTQAALTVPTAGMLMGPLTMPCPDGGVMVMTYGPLPPGLTSPISTTSRIEYRDCRSGGTLINGDPYLELASEYKMAPIGQIGSASAMSWTSTMRQTGGLLFTTNGVQGRATFDCTVETSVVSTSGTTPQVTRRSSGTITWEQPLGSPTVRPCGQPN